MILKTLALSVLTATILFAAASPSPLSVGSRSTDTGGTKAAIDAYSDGGGVLVINQSSDTKVDNSAMNSLVFKYGEAAKKDGVSLTAEIKTISGVSSVQEKSLADKIGATNYGGSSEVVAAPKLIAVPICADVAMTWNVSTNLCQKTTITIYAATQQIAGYSISATSIFNTYGLEKGVNSFRFTNAGDVGSWVYLDQNGILSGDSIISYPADYDVSAWTIGIKKSGVGFYIINDWGIGDVVQKAGNGLSGNTLGCFQACAGLQTVAGGSFKYVTAQYSGATIQWAPFYSVGAYTCPSGGTLSGSTCTLNTLSTAPGVCQAGYTLTANQCVQN